MADAIDLITAAWRQQRPDVDVSPMEVVGRITRLARFLDLELTEFFNAHGLEFWEFDVLATLVRSGGDTGLTAGALNKASMRTSGAITNRIDRLAAKDLVVRVPDATDRRSIRVQLTDKGRTLVNELLPLHVANEERLLSTLSGDDREQLVKLLRGLAESLGDTALS
ncbi:MarR family transcriptional regulator [Nocardia uniformis]|uniref:MarR family transcriptional regulator n=1 Tax=Nocardia uniformis TaxID=53432 RepID=A0A849CD53_9NOCA|nr:MarR family transcriptional regulator [Nocardia uniformis]NNH74057.1 MarR family transcriptional regulator [Nocardia uniformis]